MKTAALNIPRAGQLARLEGIGKAFGPVTALSDVSLTLEPGEIHALLGENGAGKSTLMNILFGMQAADRGKIWIDGLDVTRGWSTKDAIASGVGMIHQHFSLVREHTVLENIAMPTLGWRQLRIDWDAHRERLDTISREFGLSLNPGALVEHLTMGERQQVEILKMLYQGARILILDEPTSVLTPQQAQSLFETLGRFRDSGLSVVMITHKLSDAMRVCDRITVLRHGKFIGTVQPSDTTVSGLAQMMVAQQIEPIARLRHIPAERDVLEARALVVRNRGATAVDGVSLRVRAGEVLGIAGVAGNGQTELAQALLGLCPPHSGGIFLDRADVTGLSVRERRDAGLAFVPEDRHSMAMVAQMDVASNMILHSVGGKAFSRRGILNRAAIEANALRNVAEFDIRVRSPDAPMGTLSGGNQQKVVLSRELSGGPCALVVCELSRGLDFAATDYVRNRLLASVQEGVGVLLISSDLDELIALSHRIAVMYEGRIVGELDAADFDIDRIGLLMAGIDA